jgi:hypothetical protein
VNRILHIIAIVIIAIVLVVASVVPMAGASLECAEDDCCPKNQPDRGCADCQFCLCCTPSPRTMTSQPAVVLLAPDSMQAFWSRNDGLTPPSPDPAEIFHVPKPTLT